MARRRGGRRLSIYRNCILCQSGDSEKELGFDRIVRIRLDDSRESRPRLVIEGVDGCRMILVPGEDGSGQPVFASFAKEIIELTRRRNPFAQYVIGPDPRVWIAAWIGLVVVLVLMGFIGWAALTGQGLATQLLPAAVSPITLVIVGPTLLAGPPRRADPAEFGAAIREPDSVQASRPPPSS